MDANTIRRAMAGDELLPCPFCGGKAVRVPKGGQKNDRKTGEPLHLHGIMCDNRECAANIGNYWKDEDSASAWNTRAPLPEEPSEACGG